MAHNLLNLFIPPRHPYNYLLGDFYSYMNNKAYKTMDKNFNFIFNIGNTLYKDLKITFTQQIDILPNIIIQNSIFKNACNILIKKYENFITEHLNQVKYTYFNEQGPTSDSLHFEFYDYNSVNILQKYDYPRSKEINSQRRRHE